MKNMSIDEMISQLVEISYFPMKRFEIIENSQNNNNNSVNNIDQIYVNLLNKLFKHLNQEYSELSISFNFDQTCQHDKLILAYIRIIDNLILTNGFDTNQLVHMENLKQNINKLTFNVNLKRMNQYNSINSRINSKFTNVNYQNRITNENNLNQINIGSINYLNARQRILNKNYNNTNNKTSLDRTKSTPFK